MRKKGGFCLGGPEDAGWEWVDGDSGQLAVYKLTMTVVKRPWRRRGTRCKKSKRLWP